ncbi:hypothetical protein [Streptomyces sp. NPDC002265]
MSVRRALVHPALVRPAAVPAVGARAAGPARRSGDTGSAARRC